MNDDRLSIHEVLHLHGHLVDEGALDRLSEVFTDDVVYDLSAFGGDQLTGVAAIVDAAEALGDRNPLGHHVTNVVVVDLADSAASAVSKGLGVGRDGSVGSVVYRDRLRLTPAGWRIAYRRVLPRRTPLQPSG